PGCVRQRRLHADGPHAAIEAFQVLAQAEGPGGIYRHHLVHGIAEQEGSVERRDPGFLERQVRALEVGDGQLTAHANHSLMVSMKRRHQLPGPTAFRGCSFSLSSIWLPAMTLSVPTSASEPSGAISLGFTSVAVVGAACPRGRVR